MTEVIVNLRKLPFSGIFYLKHSFGTGKLTLFQYNNIYAVQKLNFLATVWPHI